MGNGKYNSDKTNESIMYWTTDAGFEFEYLGDVFSKDIETNVDTFIKDKFPEYIL